MTDHIKNYLRRKGAHENDIDDLAQDVEVKLLEKGERIFNPQAFAYCISRNIFFNFRKRQVTRGEIFYGDLCDMHGLTVYEIDGGLSHSLNRAFLKFQDQDREALIGYLSGVHYES